MKIRVKHKDTEVIIDETNIKYPTDIKSDKVAVLEVIKEIVESINEIKK